MEIIGCSAKAEKIELACFYKRHSPLFFLFLHYAAFKLLLRIRTECITSERLDKKRGRQPVSNTFAVNFEALNSLLSSEHSKEDSLLEGLDADAVRLSILLGDLHPGLDQLLHQHPPPPSRSWIYLGKYLTKI